MKTEIITKNVCDSSLVSTIDVPYGVKSFNECGSYMRFSFGEIIQTDTEYDQIQIAWQTLNYLDPPLKPRDIVDKDTVFTLDDFRKGTKLYTIYFNLLNKGKNLGLGVVVLAYTQCYGGYQIT